MPVAPVRADMTMMAKATPEEMCCGCPLNNLTQELAGVDEDFRKHLDDIADDWRAGIRAAFERGQDAGNIRKDVNTAAVASLVFATYQGLIGSVKTSHDQDAVSAGLSNVRNISGSTTGMSRMGASAKAQLSMDRPPTWISNSGCASLYSATR